MCASIRQMFMFLVWILISLVAAGLSIVYIFVIWAINLFIKKGNHRDGTGVH